MTSLSANQQVRPRLLWRRSATALAIYSSTALGVLGTLVAANILGPTDFGRLAVVLATTALLQLLLDLTSDEALVKHGFRYSERADWSRFRRLFELALAFKTGSALLTGLIVASLAPFADGVFDSYGLTAPLLVASMLPLLQSTEGIAASALVLRGRYDVRAGFLALAMALRLLAMAVAAPRGVTATVVGLVLAQAAVTVSISVAGLVVLGRFPRTGTRPLGDDRGPILRFVLQSSIGTGLVSLRGWMVPLLLGIVSGVQQVGLFRTAQAPQQGLAAFSAPVRLILLAEQTREWERGRPHAVLASLRRYVVGASVLMAAALVPMWLLMPWLIDLLLPDYTAATDAARIILVAGAIQFVFGWTKSFPVTIGQPNLKILAHGVELVVLVPLSLVLGSQWGATGAAGAVLASTGAFAAVWTVIIVRLHRHPTLFTPVGERAPSEKTAV